MPGSTGLSMVSPRLAGVVRPGGSRRSSGLSRALARHFRVDPLLVRIVFLGLTLISGLGLVLYFWGTALTPVEGESEPPITRWLPGFAARSTTVQLAIIAATCLLCLLGQSSVDAGASLVLVGLAWVIWSRRNATGPVAEAPVAPDGAMSLPMIDLYGPEPERGGAVAMPRPDAPASWLGALTVLAVPAVVVAVAVGLGFGATNFTLLLTAPTIALGIALLVWSLTVRRRRLPLPVLVVAAVLAAATAFLALNGGSGVMGA